MVKVEGILVDQFGKTIGARFNDNGTIKNFSTEQLREFAGIKIENAIIDVNGFVRAKSGKLNRISFRPSANQQLDIYKISRLIKNDKLTLYHGNKNKRMRPTYGAGDSNNDYGSGFYTTPDPELAKEWAWSTYTPGSQGYLHTYEINIRELKILDLSQLDSLHWIAELLFNREVNLDGKEVSQDRLELFLDKYKLNTSDYDIIIGYRADDSYFTYAENFLSSNIYRETIDNALRFGNLGIQIFIKSKKAFDRIKLVKEPEEVPSYYANRYKKRDTKARNDYAEALRNNKNVRIKQTITDFI